MKSTISRQNAFVASFVGETNFINGKIRSLSNGSAEIETSIGALHSESVYHDFVIGEEAICSIRPETINVAEKIQTTAPNQHRAKVLDATYLGRVEEYRLSIAEDVKIKAVLHNPSPHGKRMGETFQFWINPRDVIPLPARDSYRQTE